MRKSDPRENNALEGTLVEDVSKRYSKIVVVGQQQGMDDFDAGAINTMATVSDSTFPFYKPYVVTDQNDSRSPKLHAQMLLEKMKYEGFRLEYRVPGHSQGGVNWRINEMCRVTDEVLELEGDYLIFGRTFELTKDGAFTTLLLGLPGMVQ